MARARILLIQNAQAQGNGTRRFLESIGYEVVWAGNADAAFGAAENRGLDLVLMDANLLNGDGYHLCKRFRTNPETRSLPIIMITSPGFAPQPGAGPDEGPDDFLAKPYTENELNARVAAVMRAGALRNELEEKNRILAKTLSQTGTTAVIDPDTGLFSKHQFDAMFSKEFKRAMRFKQQLSCMLIDLDGERMGRVADEQLVKAIIELVQQTIREVDTAAWWTGGSLIVLLPNTIRNDAVQAAARILEAVAMHHFTWPDASRVTMSIGVAGLPDKNIDSEKKLIEAAVNACRKARDLMLPKTGFNPGTGRN